METAKPLLRCAKCGYEGREFTAPERRPDCWPIHDGCYGAPASRGDHGCQLLYLDPAEEPAAITLARRAVASRGWRWMPGMLTQEVNDTPGYGFDAMRVHHVDMCRPGNVVPYARRTK